MRKNVALKQKPKYTHEGARAAHTNVGEQLRRSVMSCMLWENEFYEDGVEIATRIASLVAACDPAEVMSIAVEARHQMKLRHAPLWLAVAMARSPAHRLLVGHTLEAIIERPDEITEFLTLYWGAQDRRTSKQKLAKQVKLGLAAAFNKFQPFALAKWDKPDGVKLRDALFMVHNKPVVGVTRRLRLAPPLVKVAYSRGEVERSDGALTALVENKLETPDTWEVSLSAGADKLETWQRLLAEKKLGALAFLRNLRNMQAVGITRESIAAYSQRIDITKVLPFRFIAAANAVPMWEPIIEEMMFRALSDMERIDGPTAVLIDHSGSMEQKVSAKSEITRFDAAAAIAMLLRELCDHVRVFTFSDKCIEVPARRGFAMRAAVKSVINPVGTLLGRAVNHVYHEFPECRRLIVVTDEQSHDRPSDPMGRGYILNVGDYRNGIGHGKWLTISGWSEAVIDYIREVERVQE
jgi:60 kDa SS-A/Ro ribonucleoprotein